MNGYDELASGLPAVWDYERAILVDYSEEILPVDASLRSFDSKGIICV